MADVGTADGSLGTSPLRLRASRRWLGARARVARLVTAERQPPLVLAGMLVAYVAVFGHLVWRQHSNWGTLGFDTGIYDQGIWLLAHGHHPFLTIRGLDYWGHHMAVIALGFVPVYLLGGGIHALALIHTAWVAAAAIPLFLLGRDRFGDAWPALVPPLAFLLHPATQWITWWQFHPDSMAIAPLCFAWWLATRKRWGWFAVAAGTALLCKEEVALAVIALGLALVFLLRARRVGAATAGVALAWYLVCTRLIIPAHISGGEPFYDSYFPSLGRGLGQIAKNSVLHPSRVLRLVFRDGCKDYAIKMLGPFAFVPLLAIPVMLIGSGQIAANLTVEVQNGATIKSQYASVPLAVLALAAVEGLGLIAHRKALLRFACGAMAACALGSSVAWGLSPLSTAFHKGDWSEHQRADVAQLRAAQRLVGPTGRVATSYNVVTHFAHRQVVYEFPNPWLSSNYGPTGNDTGDPSPIEWIVLEAGATGTRERALFQQLVLDGEFVVVTDQGGVTVAHRRAPHPVDLPFVDTNKTPPPAG